MIKKKFKIEGMHCNSCALSIDMDLEDLEGIKKAQTSYAKSELEVEFEPETVDDNKILESVKKTGYTAKPL
ncbi:heavy-metal-associated domain-containing protein [Candidatus Daviesbacteria bacterium]|nr:heavy-metal-associated domain-containing protein [Candidatus Daviesbacteria bacterium]